MSYFALAWIELLEFGLAIVFARSNEQFCEKNWVLAATTIDLVYRWLIEFSDQMCSGQMNGSRMRCDYNKSKLTSMRPVQGFESTSR